MSEVTLTVEQAMKREAELKTIIENADRLERLSKNEDFKTVIDELYLKDEPIRLVNLLTDPAQSFPEQQDKLHRAMYGIGTLTQFFRKLTQQAIQAESELFHLRESMNETEDEEVLENDAE